MKWFKFLAVLAVAVVAVSVSPNAAEADDPILNGGGRDPNHVYSAQELKASAAKKAMAKRYFHEQRAKLSPDETEVTNILFVPETDAFKEKNDDAHRNYCGPAATKIILYTWVQNSIPLPTMNEIGAAELVDQEIPGVKNWRIRDYLNNWLAEHVNPYNWDYVESINSTRGDLKSFIRWDIDAQRGLESALWTGGMPGWPAGKDVRHILAIRGYATSAKRFTVHYIETGQKAQGYTGPNNTFYQQLPMADFYNAVNAHSGSNNSQVW
ncbi:MAG: hypothetical protein HY741_15585 [Chloroflexi bacterium]|nr:hypothetical protein [Chloroflexota bacterium]